MKRIPSLCLALFLPGLLALAQTGGQAAPPKIHSEGAEFDFGEKSTSEKVTHTFTIENRGGSLLKIHNVKSSCGCTVADISSRELQPGDTATITSVFDLKFRDGPQNSRITVNSNDPVTPAYTLTLKGVGVSSITYSPRNLNFMGIQPSEPPTRTITVKSNSGDPFEIKGIRNDKGWLKTEILPKVPGLEYEIAVTPVPQEGTGSFNDFIIIQTSDATVGPMRVAVAWQVQAPVMVVPTLLSLVSTENAQPINRFLMVRGGPNLATPLQVIGAMWPGREEVKFHVSNAGTYGWRIEARGIVPAPEMDGETIQVFTNVPGFETNQVPVKVISHTAVKSVGPR